MIRSRRGGSRRNVETAELNITAFMNLMVILVPFLLITAVFSRLAILELNLPGSSSEPVEPQEQTFQLEVTVRTDRLEVGDRHRTALGESTEAGTPRTRDSFPLAGHLHVRDDVPDRSGTPLLGRRESGSRYADRCDRGG